MKGLIPFGAITVSGPGAATQALSTTLALLALFDDTGGANVNGTFDDGYPSVYPDKANNRVLVEAPGVYEVDVILSGITDAAQDIWINLAKNATAISDMQTRTRWTDAVKNQIVLSGFVTIATSDNPGTIATKPDYDATAGAGKPAGGFGGNAAFPKNMVPLTLLIKSGASTPTITLEHAQFKVKRVG